MKVLGIFGSPRHNGNTDLLLEAFLKGAVQAGAEVERIYIRDLKIKPCAEHMVCFKTGYCDIQDEMEKIYPCLLAADIVVLAAPVFFYSVPAQAKAFIDRCQALWARKHILKRLPPAQTDKGIPRRGFFISVGGTKGAKLFDGVILTVKYFFDAVGVTYGGDLLFRSIDRPDAIREHPTALTDAFNKGKLLIETTD